DTTATELYTLSLHDALPIFTGPSSLSTVRLERSPPTQSSCRWWTIMGQSSLRQLLQSRLFSGATYKGYWSLYRESSQSRPLTVRSEEHTSELQSRGHLVCRL